MSGPGGGTEPSGGFADFVARHLYGKASPGLVEERSLEDLASIAIKAAKLLRQWLKDKDGPLITSSDRSVFVIMHDCPFIVNTINETLRAHSLQSVVFLHPVLFLDNQPVSLSYVELEGSGIPVGSNVSDHLARCLRELTLVTHDFPEMTKETERLSKLLRARSASSDEEREVIKSSEYGDFLHWLCDGGFVFMGLLRWDCKNGIHPDAAIRLGLFRQEAPHAEALLEEIGRQISSGCSLAFLSVSRLNTISPVHRFWRLTHLLVRDLESDCYCSLIGVLTSKALSQEASSIPLVRKKLKAILEIEDAIPGTHDYKMIERLIDSMPKHEVLVLDVKTLRDELRLTLDMLPAPECRVIARPDPAGRGVWMVALLPASRFRADIPGRFIGVVCKVFSLSPSAVDYFLSPFVANVARLYCYISETGVFVHGGPEAALEAELLTLTSTWEERLQRDIAEKHPAHAAALIHRFARAFDEHYQAQNEPEQAVNDIGLIESLSEEKRLRLSFHGKSSGSELQVSLATINRRFVLGQAVPIFENAGFEVLGEEVFVMKTQDGQVFFIHRMELRTKNGEDCRQEAFRDVISPGLELVFLGREKNDVLNSLMLRAGLTPRPIAILRAYCLLLYQMRKFASRQSLRTSLSDLPEAAVRLWELFRIKFDPSLDLSLDERRARTAELGLRFREWLRGVKDLNHDRILRALLSLVEQTLRTNFFTGTDTIAIKIWSERLDILSGFRPKYEIFVSDPAFEGVHLRTSKVSRGGIRWSERRDDYRTEVLGLVKTQRVKNAVIVPSGAKGGFVVKEQVAGREALSRAVLRSYQGFIRALLSLTDNRIEERVSHPAGLVIYDDDDPYFVVAADKGTAKFSDVANKIAKDEFNFWLGDAFASGGSYGYDHKKLGITAKGAWECAKEHLKALGINYESDTFSAVGIGDMSGDVFGNGMLLSGQMKLIGAFDHRHVFIDPDPDPALSFRERERLFTLPASSWTDYRKDLISPGGGVFGRDEKEIRLSREARAALGLGPDTPDLMNGEQLITCVLRAPAILLWNGGIGTYVKSREENDAAVDDSSNDRVRINADELRVKIVAEGGNLGFTQRARIEFSKLGGKINTDAIDNSAGVDLSDHEVNLKLLFRGSSGDGEKKRNEVLQGVTADVCRSVVSHNRNHAVLLSIGEIRSRKSIGYFGSLIRDLAKAGYVNRSADVLPEDDELQRRGRNQQGLYRPELAACLAGVKLWLQDEIVNSPLLLDSSFGQRLLKLYFPERIRQLYPQEVENHPLRRHIIATEMTNRLIDIGGIVTPHRLSINHAVSTQTALGGLLAAYELLDTERLLASIERLDTPSHHKYFMMLRMEIGRALRDAAAWFISAHRTDLGRTDVAGRYAREFNALVEHQDALVRGDLGRYVESRRQALPETLPSLEAQKWVSILPITTVLLEVIETSYESGNDLEKTAACYSSVVTALELFPVLNIDRSLEAKSKWEHEFTINTFEEIRKSISLICLELVKRGISAERVAGTLRESQSFARLKLTLAEFNTKTPDVAVLAVVARQLRNYVFE